MWKAQLADNALEREPRRKQWLESKSLLEVSSRTGIWNIRSEWSLSLGEVEEHSKLSQAQIVFHPEAIVRSEMIDNTHIKMRGSMKLGAPLEYGVPLL